MTEPAGRRARLLALATTICAAAITLGATSTQSASATAPCVITGGNVQATDPVHVGDTVRADAHVTGACSGRTITFEGGGRVVGSGLMSSYKSYYTEFGAFAGLSTVTASVDGGNGVILGSVTVVAATPTPTPPPSTAAFSSTAVRPPASHPATSSASSSTPPTQSATRSLTPHTAAFPAAVGNTSASDSSTPQPSASDAPTSSEIALPVQVIHGSGGVDLIPSGVLIATVVVLGAIGGAAVHFVRAYSRSPDHLT